jgi:hypothetical protein
VRRDGVWLRLARGERAVGGGIWCAAVVGSSGGGVSTFGGAVKAREDEVRDGVFLGCNVVVDSLLEALANALGGDCAQVAGGEDAVDDGGVGRSDFLGDWEEAELVGVLLHKCWLKI